MRRELTWQAVVTAIVVAAVVSASYPYVLLKLGIGPNVSVVSAFLGAVGLLILARKTHGQNRLMNNIVQTAGTSAAMTAFMCVIAAAVDLADQNPVVQDKLNGIHKIDPWPMFWWLTCAGGIGVLFTVIFRRHFLDDPKLVFADGVAAAETIVVLDSPGSEARDKLSALGLSSLFSAAVYLFREGVGIFKDRWEGLKHFEILKDSYPDDLIPGAMFRPYRVGMEWNLLSIGAGMLIGINVGLSLLVGSLIVRGVGPYLIETGIGREIVLSNISPERRSECEKLIDKKWDDLSESEKTLVKQPGSKQPDYMQGKFFNVVLLWFMWPATGLMIFSAVTAVLLKWRTVVASFTQLRAHQAEGKREDVSVGTIVIGSALLTIVLAIIQKENFGLSYLQTGVAVLCTLPLILVGNRVLGETNFGPISVMMNGLQAIFGVLWPGAVGHNLIAAGMAGSCNSQGQGTIQDYKTGQIIGSTPRILTWVQLGAVPIGAAAVAVMYPLLTQRYVIGDTLSAPTALKITNMAVLLSQGIDALPRGALLWTVIASVAGILITIVKEYTHWNWLPSPTGLGLGLIIPGLTIIPMALGGILGWVWEKSAKESYDRYFVTVASGLIAGEALLAGVVVPILAWLIL
jgi:uncharacterized oligopeptide transporter (OPT) family protein